MAAITYQVKFNRILLILKLFQNPTTYIYLSLNLLNANYSTVDILFYFILVFNVRIV